MFAPMLAAATTERDRADMTEVSDQLDKMHGAFSHRGSRNRGPHRRRRARRQLQPCDRDIGEVSSEAAQFSRRGRGQEP